MTTGSPHVVSDALTRSVAVATVDGAASFKDIVRAMQERKVGALPVLDAVDRVLGGVVSEADPLPKEKFRDSDPDRYTQVRRLSDLRGGGSVTAAELISSPALTVPADVTLTQAARDMVRVRVKRLPVVDDGRLLGIVSPADLLKVFPREEEEITEEVRLVRAVEGVGDVRFVLGGQEPPMVRRRGFHGLHHGRSGAGRP
ncbi:CBS domain-containing protein [Streptomyces sp. NPDC101175]|uniref:CBS domain-containing protein n=1 Tax=Streptomyces sp. NPDC101175 TaxID=3366123 RepID=UPI0038376A34